MSVLAGQVLRFGAVGVVGTAAYLGVFLVLRVQFDAQSAGVVARVLVAVPTTWLHSRFTFASRVGGLRLQLAGVLLLSVGMATTSGALLLQQVLLGEPARRAELVVVAVANVVAAAVRFLLLRAWMTPTLSRATGPRRVGRVHPTRGRAHRPRVPDPHGRRRGAGRQG